MENPTLPTIWLMPLSNALQHPGFQESEQETDPATSDFRNQTLTAHMMVLIQTRKDNSVVGFQKSK